MCGLWLHHQWKSLSEHLSPFPYSRSWFQLAARANSGQQASWLRKWIPDPHLVSSWPLASGQAQGQSLCAWGINPQVGALSLLVFLPLSVTNFGKKEAGQDKYIYTHVYTQSFLSLSIKHIKTWKKCHIDFLNKSPYS